MNIQWQERLAVVAVLLTLVAVPAFGSYYQQYLESRMVREAGGTGEVHIYHLTGIFKPGMWTLDKIMGYNYWWQKPRRLEEIKVNKGDTVILSVTSADVEHGVIIPGLGIDPIEIEAGHRKVITFVADRAGSFPILCAKVCSCTGAGFACTLDKKDGHEGMMVVLTVEELLGPPNANVDVSISETKGFEPETIRVRQDDVVQLRITSQSDGIGDGVGFCISEYETKVDLQGIRNGQSRTFKFKADKAGTFIIYSSTDAGEGINSATGTFIVVGTEAAAETQSEETQPTAQAGMVTSEELEALESEFEGL